MALRYPFPQLNALDCILMREDGRSRETMKVHLAKPVQERAFAGFEAEAPEFPERNRGRRLTEQPLSAMPNGLHSTRRNAKTLRVAR